MKKFLVVLSFVLPFFSGCGERSKLDVTAVTGTVTVDGRPMEGINIIFHPSDSGEIAAFGSTDAQGKYKLSSPSAPVGSGAVAGEYIPTFSKMEAEQRPEMPPEEQWAKYGDTPAKVTHLIPEKYGVPKTCGIAPVKVEKGEKNLFDFDLKSGI